MEFNIEKIDKIVKEYLGISEEYLEFIDYDRLINDIKYIINKYKHEDKIGYILQADYEENRHGVKAKQIENVNGIIVYKEVKDYE